MLLLLLLLYLGDGRVGCAADRAARCGRDGAQLLEQGRALGGGWRRLAVANGGGGLCKARLTRVSSRPDLPAVCGAMPGVGAACAAYEGEDAKLLEELVALAPGRLGRRGPRAVPRLHWG